jgi:hypothetical protein
MFSKFKKLAETAQELADSGLQKLSHPLVAGLLAKARERSKENKRRMVPLRKLMMFNHAIQQDYLRERQVPSTESEFSGPPVARFTLQLTGVGHVVMAMRRLPR